MNRKCRIFALLLAAPLLAGCGNNVKAPKFAKYGDEKKADACINAASKALNKSTLYQDKALPSFEAKLKSKVFEEGKKMRNNKEYNTSHYFSEDQETMKYSKDDMLFEHILKENEKTVYANADGEEVINKEDNNDLIYQYDKVGKKNYIVEANVKAKEYVGLTEVEDKKAAKEAFDIFAKMRAENLLNGVYEIFSSYEGSDDEAKESYKFYQNENTYTVEVDYEDEGQNKDGGKTYCEYKYNWKWIVQLTLRDNGFDVKVYDEEIETYEYVMKKGEFIKGDVYNWSYYSSFEGSLNYKDVKIQRADLSQYTPLFF